MALVGAFDLAVADRLSARLDQLAADRTRVRIDLGRVQFIDSSGIRALVLAVRNGRQDGVALVEINPRDDTRRAQGDRSMWC
jgi:anti-anti-sigma factor